MNIGVVLSFLTTLSAAEVIAFPSQPALDLPAESILIFPVSSWRPVSMSALPGWTLIARVFGVEAGQAKRRDALVFVVQSDRAATLTGELSFILLRPVIVFALS